MSTGAVEAEVLTAYWPLLLEGERILAARGNSIYVSRDEGKSFALLAGREPGRGPTRLFARCRLAKRVGRLGFHALRRLPDGGLLAVVRREILLLPKNASRFRTVLRFKRGSRPLRLCVTPDGWAYFGEYFSNDSRDAVHIYAAKGGRNWHRAFTFEAGAIRHIHGVIHDPIREGLWVLTGDEDHESGLWFTSDRFGHLNSVAGGDQRFRAVSIIPTPDGLILPTDSPQIRNRIQHFDPTNGTLESLHPLSGSAFHALRSAGLFLISTVDEPRRDHPSDGAALFASQNGYDWHRMSQCQPDLVYRAAKGFEHLFRYPELALVPGCNETEHVYAGGRSVRGADGCLLRWRVDDLKRVLERKES